MCPARSGQKACSVNHHLILPAVLAVPAVAVAGPFSGPTDGIPSDSPAFVAWADDIIESGTSFAPRGSTSIDETGGFNSLGDLAAGEIADGVEPGQLTVSFPFNLADGPGDDFAVFENGFVFPNDPFLVAELAYVEVSSNGTDFARFDSVSTNVDFEGTFGQSFGGFDATNIDGLAGKHVEGFGTPFDLAALENDPLVLAGDLDLDDVAFVRLVDIPGNGAFTDSLGNPILDAWLTEGSGGFDFRLGEGVGIGAINVVPEPALASVGLLAAGIVARRRR